MDVNLLKSATEDQMEMMMMMMQMDKLPEFCGPYPEVNQLPSSIAYLSACATATTSSIDTTLPIFSNLHVTSPPTPASSISFIGNSTIQEPVAVVPPMLSNAMATSSQSQKRNSMAAMRDMIFRIAAMQPIHIDPESVKPPKRRNVRISKDPQSVAARHRRERISEKIRILQRLVPGGTKMDTASMLDEAIHYVKFLKNQVQSLERAAVNRPMGLGFPSTVCNPNYSSSLGKAYLHPPQMFSSTQMLS